MTESAEETSKSVTNSLPCDVRDALRIFARSLEATLGQNLLGIYLYGSVASGCYNGKTSDVDVVAVLRGSISQEAKEAILEAHRTSTVHMDGMYVTENELNRNVCPIPVQCAIRRMKIFRVPNGAADFPIIRNDLYTNGLCIVGPEMRCVVRPVPWALLRSCLMDMFPVALERSKNPVLMLCRIVCSLRTRQACSKAQAAAWALEHFEPKWHPLLQQSLDDYRTGQPAPDLPAEVAQAFEQYCREQVQEC